MSSSTFNDTISFIHVHADEGELLAIAAAAREALKDVRNRNAKVAVASIKVGQRVALNEGVSPKYMIGATGVVTNKYKTKFLVKMDDPNTRFGAESRVPASLIDVVEGDAADVKTSAPLALVRDIDI